jgi:hypothetical protein
MNIESFGIFRNILVFERGSPKLIDWSIGCLCTMERVGAIGNNLGNTRELCDR